MYRGRHESAADLHEVRLQHHVCIKAPTHPHCWVEHTARWPSTSPPTCSPRRCLAEASFRMLPDQENAGDTYAPGSMRV